MLLLTGLISCRKQAPSSAPLIFCDVQTKVGLSSYYEDFQVWGYCLAESGSDIMPGYKVFHDAVLGWCYTELAGTEGQELQFWSYSASLYRFHAGAPLSRVKAMDATSLTLEMKAGTDILQTSLFSEPYLVKRGDPAFGSTVNLAFVYANSKAEPRLQMRILGGCKHNGYKAHASKRLCHLRTVGTVLRLGSPGGECQSPER